MEYIFSKPVAGRVQIEGYPDAVKLILLKSKRGRRLAHLSLHQIDLQFALESLNALNIGGVSEHVQQSLWRSAIVHFYKCFNAGKSRFSLQASQVYKDQQPEAMQNFKHFKLIRDKHLAHDESPYTQAVAGAALNDGTKAYKVEKLIVANVSAQTLDKQQYPNFRLLVIDAQMWVEDNFDALCDVLTAELEATPYADLLAMPPVAPDVPTLATLGTTRER